MLQPARVGINSPALMTVEPVFLARSRWQRARSEEQGEYFSEQGEYLSLATPPHDRL